MATREEEINHDLEGVIACFHEEPVVVDSDGRRHEGVDALRRLYRFQFSLAADGRCDLRSLVGNDGRGMAESLFHGTLARDGTVIRALGAEVFEFAEERIKEIRDHHRVVDCPAATDGRTLVPFVVGCVTINRLDPQAVLLGFGRTALATVVRHLDPHALVEIQAETKRRLRLLGHRHDRPVRRHPHDHVADAHT